MCQKTRRSASTSLIWYGKRLNHGLLFNCADQLSDLIDILNSRQRFGSRIGYRIGRRETNLEAAAAKAPHRAARWGPARHGALDVRKLQFVDAPNLQREATTEVFRQGAVSLGACRRTPNQCHDRHVMMLAFRMKLVVSSARRLRTHNGAAAFWMATQVVAFCLIAARWTHVLRRRLTGPNGRHLDCLSSGSLRRVGVISVWLEVGAANPSAQKTATNLRLSGNRKPAQSNR